MKWLDGSLALRIGVGDIPESAKGFASYIAARIGNGVASYTADSTSAALIWLI